MPKQANVKKNWSRTNGDKLSGQVKNVGDSMKDNSNFKTPAVAPDAMIEKSGSIMSAYNNRRNGSVGREAYKKALADGNEVMDKQANYVSEVAEGDVNIIVSAGFEATSVTNSKAVVPQTPQPPALMNVNGELSMKLKRVKGATSYCYLIFVGEMGEASVTNSQIAVSPKANVIIIPAGTTRECARGLASGTKVYVMALAQNSAGKSAFSPAVSICIA